MNIGEIRTQLTADMSQMQRTMEQAERQLRDYEQTTDRQLDKAESRWRTFGRNVGSRLNRMRKGMMSWQTGIAAAAGAAGLGYLIKRNLEAADSIAKTADAVGLSTKALQEYRYIANRSGVQTGKFEKALERATARFAQVEAESGAFYSRLKDVNSELVNQVANASSNAEAIDLVFKSMRNARDETQKMRIATAAFGNTHGARVAQMVEDSEQLRRRFEELGLAIDEELLRGAEDAKDAIDDVTKVIGQSFTKAVLEFAPEIENAASNMADWVSNNEDLIAQDLPQTLKAIGEGIVFVGKGLKAISIDAPNALARAIYGPETAEGITEEKLKGIREEITILADKLKRLQVNPELNAEQISDIEEKLKKLRREEEIYQKSLQDYRGTAFEAAEADKMLWEQMGKLGEQTEKNNEQLTLLIEKYREWQKYTDSVAEDIERQTLGLEALAERQKQLTISYQDIAVRGKEGVEKAQRTRAMAPAFVSDETLVEYNKKMDDMRNKTEETYDYMEEFSRRTAQNMQNNFSDFFFDAFTGKLDSASDYFQSFANSLLRTWSDMQAKMLAKGLFGKDFMKGESDSGMGGLFGKIGSGIMEAIGGGSGGASSMSGPDLFRWSGGSATSYDTGGKLPEDVYGFGPSGNRYKMHEGETLQSSSGGGTEIHIHEAPQGTQVKRQEKSGGGERIDVILDRTMAQNIGKDGETAQMLETKYGLSPNLAPR